MRVARPTRASHSYTQRLAASPAEVFPLLCPVREADWIEGWDPLAVFSDSGLAERDCVFVTQGSPEAVWYVTRHEPETLFVEMLKITPGVTACRLTISLSPAPHGCDAEVGYTHTSLGTSEGDEFVAAFTAEHYREFMLDWESRLNHYLRTGERLPGER